ncbi:MAG: hypothetical protein ACFFDT_18655 [Candidatus Hodarchaeota archaeon]
MVSNKKILVGVLVCSVLIVAVFVFIHLYTEIDVSYEPHYHIEVYLNETTKGNLTAVFFFNNSYTKYTDNSTLNQEFLDYFIQRLEVIKSQVPGIKSFIFSFYINDSNIYPEYDSSISDHKAKFEACNKTATLFLEEWFVLNAKVIRIQY